MEPREAAAHQVQSPYPVQQLATVLVRLQHRDAALVTNAYRSHFSAPTISVQLLPGQDRSPGVWEPEELFTVMRLT